MGERRELPQRQRGPGTGAEIRPKTDFWRILKATERFFCTYMTKSEGTIYISVPYSKYWGYLLPPSPRDLRPS